jgi:hypothetical protein
MKEKEKEAEPNPVLKGDDGKSGEVVQISSEDTIAGPQYRSNKDAPFTNGHTRKSSHVSILSPLAGVAMRFSTSQYRMQ